MREKKKTESPIASRRHHASDNARVHHSSGADNETQRHITEGQCHITNQQSAWAGGEGGVEVGGVGGCES